MPKRAEKFIGALIVLAVLMLAMLAHAAWSGRASGPVHAYRLALVKEYGLSDLCIFTEARYTRHPSLADLHSAFQDHPSALEHFPSGSLMMPPPHLRAQAESGETIR